MADTGAWRHSRDYHVDGAGAQSCGLCGEVEPWIDGADGYDESTIRSAAHLVHGVRAHYMDVAFNGSSK